MFDELKKPLPENELSQRKQGGKTLYYLETWWVIKNANRIFGYGGWSAGVEKIEIVWRGDIETRDRGPRHEVHAICTGWVSVGDARFFDVGYGSGMGYSNEGEPHELAVKEARSDCLKRCLRHFGDQFGNHLYNKARKKQPTPPTRDKSSQDDNPPPTQDNKRLFWVNLKASSKLTDKSEKSIIDGVISDLCNDPRAEELCKTAGCDCPLVAGMPTEDVGWVVMSNMIDEERVAESVKMYTAAVLMKGKK